MLSSIETKAFDSEILEEEKPVLLACFHSGDDIREEIQTLEILSGRYGERLKICYMLEDSIDALTEAFQIEGTPTYLIFDGGREKSRLLGRGDMETLRSLVLGSFPHLEHDTLTARG
jgi:hypothetical protein